MYYDSLQTTSGCDSVLVLDLTINNSYEAAIDTVVACDMPYGRVQRTASGLYYDSLQTTSGCDGVLVLDLTINNSYEAAIDIVAVIVRFGRVQHTQQVGCITIVYKLHLGVIVYWCWI